MAVPSRVMRTSRSIFACPLDGTQSDAGSLSPLLDAFTWMHREDDITAGSASGVRSLAFLRQRGKALFSQMDPRRSDSGRRRARWSRRARGRSVELPVSARREYRVGAHLCWAPCIVSYGG